MQSLWTSLTALKSSSTWLDSIGNNIANQDTPGFDSQNVTFADALTAAQGAGSTAGSVSGRYTPPGFAGGTGVIPAAVETDFSQLPLQQTGQATDLAISGPGFFRIATPNGIELTKAGNFIWSRNAQGQTVLATPEGYPVLDVNGQPIVHTGSPDAKFSVGPDGQVTFDGAGRQRIAIVEVSSPSQTLVSAGANAYAAQAGAAPRIINAGAANQGNSTISQGTLAMSNVDLTTEMTNMISAQRMFDLNSEALQLTNRLMGAANNIKQGG